MSPRQVKVVVVELDVEELRALIDMLNGESQRRSFPSALETARRVLVSSEARAELEKHRG